MKIIELIISIVLSLISKSRKLKIKGNDFEITYEETKPPTVIDNKMHFSGNICMLIALAISIMLFIVFRDAFSAIDIQPLFIAL